nr:hypothetical protein [Tanacetum cinerariifolium]
ILNGDSPTPTRVIEGVIQPVAPTTVVQRLARKNEFKARGTLLMALPDKHQLKFNIHKDAKTLMKAIEKRFRGNTETKKKLISQLEILRESLSQEDINLKFLRSLPTEWRTHTLIWRNKTNLEEQSLDDLFNSLKIYEAERTRRNLIENRPTSMGFDMSKVECYNCHITGHFTRECRSPKDTKRNGAAEPQRRNVPVETSTSNALVSQCDGVGSYDWSFQADKEPTNYALMAFTSLSSSSDNDLPIEWRTHTLIWRNKTDLEEQSLDDLFNSLKIYEAEVKSSSSASTFTPYIVFVSSNNTDSTNKPVSAVASVFAARAKILVSALPNVDTLSNARTGRNLRANRPTSMGSDMSKVECYNCRKKDTLQGSVGLLRIQEGMAEEEPTNYALMAFTSSSSSSSDNELRDNALVVLRQKFKKAKQERDDLKLKLEKFQTSSKNLSQLLANQTNDKTRLGYNTQVFTSFMFDCDEMFTSETDDSLPASRHYDMYHSEDGSHAVPLPYTGTFMPPKTDLVFHDAPNVNETNHTAFNVELSPTKLDKDLSHTHRHSTPIIEDWSLTQKMILRLRFHRMPLLTIIRQPFQSLKAMATIGIERMTLPNPQRHVVPTAVLTKSKPNPITAARPVIVVVPKPHVTRPRQAKTIVTKPHSPPKRQINHSSSPTASTFPPKVTAAKAPMDKGVIDSGCSRHITGNMSYLSDFKEINGGYVAFGGNPKGGKISGKGSGPTWLFDIDTLTKTMNYQPVTADKEPEFKDNEHEFEGRKPESEVYVSPSSKFEDFSNNNINEVNIADSPVPAVGQISTNNTNTFSVAGPLNVAVKLEDITYSDDEEDVGAEADFTNLESTITVRPIPTTRVHKDHPINNDDFHTCMFVCFLSQEEPKRIHQALEDPSWIEAIQEELLQFKMQKEEGIDYEELFAPVARIEAIRLFLAYASFMDFMVFQMDVKSDFLYETIKEKALYGLHQAPRAWYETLANYLLENGFQSGKIDQTLFIKRQKGELAFFLGPQVKQKQDGIFISLDKYVAEILRKFGLTDGKLASTLIDTKKPLLKDPDGEDVDVHTYISMIGSLMYLTSSRPDIMFAYPKYSPFNLVAYSDSDYAGASLDRKSTTGGCKFLGCRLISWQYKKQIVVATLSTEAEYVAAASCCAQMLWTQN